MPSAPGGSAVDWSQLTRTAGLANHLEALIRSLGTTSLQQFKHRWADQALLQQLLVGLRKSWVRAEPCEAKQQTKGAEGLHRHRDLPHTLHPAHNAWRCEWPQPRQPEGMNVTQARRHLEQWLEQGEIEVATHRCGLDWLQVKKPGDQALLNSGSVEGLEQWGRQNALHWQESLDADAFAERFDVGHGRTYGCIEQMLSCIDVPLLVELLSQVEPADG